MELVGLARKDSEWEPHSADEIPSSVCKSILHSNATSVVSAVVTDSLQGLRQTPKRILTALFEEGSPTIDAKSLDSVSIGGMATFFHSEGFGVPAPTAVVDALFDKGLFSYFTESQINHAFSGIIPSSAFSHTYPESFARSVVHPMVGPLRGAREALAELDACIDRADAHGVSFLLTISCRLMETIQLLDESDDDLGIELPPQTKTLYSQHTIRVLYLQRDTPTTEIVCLLSGLRICSEIRTADHQGIYVVSTEDSPLMSLFMFPLPAITSEVSDFSDVRQVATLLASSGPWLFAYERLYSQRCTELDRRRECFSVTETDPLRLSDKSDSQSGVAGGCDSIVVAPAPNAVLLAEENAQLRAQVRELQRLLEGERQSEAHTSIGGHMLSPDDLASSRMVLSPIVARKANEGEVADAQLGLADSFALPSPRELRERRKREKGLFGSFAHSLYYMNTQDSFNFQYPPPFQLDGSCQQKRPHNYSSFRFGQSHISVAGNSLLDVGEDGAVKGFAGDGIHSPCRNVSFVDPQKGGSSKRQRAMLSESAVENGSFLLSPNHVSWRELHLSVTSLHRAEVAQRLAIEHQSLNEFHSHVLQPYISFLHRFVESNKCGSPERSSDLVSLLIGDMLEEHAEGMAALLADLIDEKGAALFDAVVEAGVRSHRASSIPLEPVAEPVALGHAEQEPTQKLPVGTWVLAPSAQEMTKRIEVHKILILTGKNWEGERLRSLGYQLPPLRIEALQEETRNWRIPLAAASNPGSSPLALGPHVGSSLDDYRAMSAYNFVFVGEANVGTSSVVACMTTKAPKLFKKCPQVFSPTLGVTRHLHFCSLQFSPSAFVPQGGLDATPNLNVNMLLRDSASAFNASFSSKCDWPRGYPACPIPFSVSLPPSNGTFGINFVEIPTPVLELGLSSPCTGEGPSPQPNSRCTTGPWWGTRHTGSLPSKGSVYFLTYDLTEDITMSRRNLMRALKNILASLIPVGDSCVRTVPFILVGTRSDLLRPAGGASADSDHHSTLLTILRSQREWFLEVTAELTVSSSQFTPVMLDAFAVSCKEWTVSGERPRSASDFESLTTSTLQSLAVHSPISPVHLLPSLIDVVNRSLGSIGSDSVTDCLGLLKGCQRVPWRGSCNASALFADVQSVESSASCSLERLWSELTDCKMTSSATGDARDQGASNRSGFLSFVTGKQQCQDVGDKGQRGVALISHVLSLVLPEIGEVSALAKGVALADGSQPVSGLPVSCGLQSVVHKGAAHDNPHALLIKMSLPSEMETLPSGHLLDPLLRRVGDWLACAPYGMVTLLTALKRFADVSSVLVDGHTMVFLIHQHLGMLPYSTSSSHKVDAAKAPQRDESDSILSPAFRAHVETQYQELQLYLEQQKKIRRDAKGRGEGFPSTHEGLSNSAADSFSANPLSSISTEEIRQRCPVVGLNNEKYWPPELLNCRSVIVDHVVSQLVSRGIIQPLFTTPSTHCFAIGHIWRDSLLTGLGSLKVAQAAALLPRSSITIRSSAIPLALLTSKEHCGGPSGAISSLASACGFTGGTHGITQERCLSSLFSRLSSQGLVPSSAGSGGGSVALSTTWAASSGVPSEPNPWCGTNRLLNGSFPLSLESISADDMHRYLSGYVTPRLLRSIATGPLKWLGQPRDESGSIHQCASQIALSISGAVNALSVDGVYGSVVHSARHFLLQMSRLLESADPKVTPEQRSRVEGYLGRIRRLADHCSRDDYVAAEDDIFVPQLVGSRATRSVLDGVGYMLSAGCEYSATATISLRGSVPSVVGSRVIGSASVALASFVIDVYRECCAVLLTSAGGNSPTIDTELLKQAERIDALLSRPELARPYSIVDAWENAAAFSLLDGVFWCLLARDDSTFAASAMTDRYVVVVGVNSQHPLVDNLAESSGLAEAGCSAICAAFLRETRPFNGVEFVVEGEGIPSAQQSLLYSPQLTPIHSNWFSPKNTIRTLQSARNIPSPWTTVRETLSSMAAEVAMDGRGKGAGAMAINGPNGHSRLLSESDYTLQLHDAMVAATCGFNGQMAEGATILASQKMSEHLYLHPLAAAAAKKDALRTLLEVAQHMVQGTRTVDLRELVRSLEGCL